MLNLLPRHHYGACRVSTALWAQLPQQAPTPTTTPKSGWVLFSRLALSSGSFLPRTLPKVTHRPLASLMSLCESVADEPLHPRKPTPHPLKGAFSLKCTAYCALILTLRPSRANHGESAADEPLRTRQPTPHPLKGAFSFYSLKVFTPGCAHGEKEIKRKNFRK